MYFKTQADVAFCTTDEFSDYTLKATYFPRHKGPVKLIQRVKIARSFLHVMSKLFNPIIFSLSG